MLEETAKQMAWHKHGIRKELDENGDPMPVHPSDGNAWKAFDGKHTKKSKETRNCRIAIGLDGFNPFGISCYFLFICVYIWHNCRITIGSRRGRRRQRRRTSRKSARDY